MADIRDGDELSMSIPEGGGACLRYPPALPASRDPSACTSTGLASLEPAPPERLVAAGSVRIDGVPTPVSFAVRFTPDGNAAEATPESARDFAAHEVAERAPGADADGRGDAAAVDIVAVGGSPARAAPTSDVVTLGGIRAARASFVLDLRESGHDVPLLFVSYGAWAREGLYTLSVEGDGFHAAAVEAFADESAKTLWLKDPAPPAPGDAAQIGVRLGQTGLVVVVLLAVMLGVLGARTRRMRR